VAGTLAAGGVVSPRIQAVAAASVLALSTATPAGVVFAAEPDREQDGAAPATPNGTTDLASDPGFDPGGDQENLPTASVPPAHALDHGLAVSTDEDAGAVEQAPAADPAEPLVDAGDGSDPTEAQAPPSAGAPAAPAPAEVTQPAPAPSTPNATASPPTPAPTEVPASAEVEAGTRSREKKETTDNEEASREDRVARVQVAPTGGVVVPTAPVARPVPQAVTATSTAVAITGRAARPGDRTHTVRPGESLWAIAADVLGDEATVARIAREVHRLWQLNRDRIGTGDPDLLMIGTRLRLR
jgi:nucleoid-associated protein YgaU